MQWNLFDDIWMTKLNQRFGRRKFLFLLIAIMWLPVVLLSLFHGESILLDYATNVRIFISLPILYVSFSAVSKKINYVLEHFLKAYLISKRDEEEFFAILKDSEALAKSGKAKAIILMVIFMLMAYEFFFASPVVVIPWRNTGNPAAWWFYLVTQPIYYFIQYSFLYRTIVWCLTLLKISRMNLALWPAHGDGVGGIAFLSNSIFSFLAPIFAMSSSAAGATANLVTYGGMTLGGIKIVLVVIAAITYLFYAGPMFFFVPVLIRSKIRFILDYDIASSQQMKMFRQKWLAAPADQKDFLDVQDFSAITDYGSEVGRVNGMNFLPLKLTDLIMIGLAMAIPFIPVFAMKMPWREVIKLLIGILH